MKHAFTVPGKPQPKERPRLGKNRTYTPEKTRAYEQLVGMSGLLARPRGWPMDELYQIRCVFYWSDRYRRDVDNTLKSIKDGLNGILWGDDHQVKLATALGYPNPVPKGAECALVIVEVVDMDRLINIAVKAQLEVCREVNHGA